MNIPVLFMNTLFIYLQVSIPVTQLLNLGNSVIGGTEKLISCVHCVKELLVPLCTGNIVAVSDLLFAWRSKLHTDLNYKIKTSYL